MAEKSMKDELTALRKELERLKKENVTETVVEVEDDSALDALVDGAHEFEDELESKAHEVLEQMKLDYDNMSPATAVAIFSAGALFGRLFLSK